VLGRRTIRALHYRHDSVDGSYDFDNGFRRDLTEIARMVRLESAIAVHVDAARKIVRVTAGEPARYFRDAVDFATTAFAAPPPGDADVVIANAYPMDVSLTVMRSKGIIPLLHARPGASRVLMAAVPEGVGSHGLFPFMNAPRFQAQRHLTRVAMAHPGDVPAKLVRRLVRRSAPTALSAPPAARNPIWLYPPGVPYGGLPADIPGMTACYRWDQIIEAVAAEQGGRSDLKVVVYPCAPLQVLGGVITD